MAALSPLPDTTQSFIDWNWEQIEPYFVELEERPLSDSNAAQWLKDWSTLSELLYESYARLSVAVTLNTADTVAEARFNAFIENIYPKAQSADQKLKQKLLASGLEVSGFEIPLRNMRTDAAIFREENLPLFVEETKLGNEYDKVIGAQMVQWQGEEFTITKLKAQQNSPDRSVREGLFRAISTRQLQDRQALNELWVKLFPIRRQIAQNAGFEGYRDYVWKALYRFDYTPEDCVSFHEAIEKTVVPVVKKLAEKRRKAFGVDVLKPWDMWNMDVRVNIDPHNRPALKPYADVAEMESKAANIFNQVDAELGEQFEAMRRGGLLDLENRKGKAPGGYCTSFARERRPFIFMNAVGLHDDVQTLLHEAGHAFHVFETAALPYIHQMNYTSEIAEVASMAMELLAQPYLTADKGGYYTPADAARATEEHLEGMLLFWPYMAVVDAFQHWVYTSGDAPLDTANCDAQWSALWDRFMGYQDWSGFEAEKATGWQRKLHIFKAPFYYIEYGVAQLGAAQVWANALRDQAAATAAYRRALALGGTRPLPELYAAAGAKLAFDVETLGSSVALLDQKLDELAQVS